MYKVAVIIPTLNEERFIGKCLDSVIAQTTPMKDMDVMIVDGGSQDKTKEIVDGYSSRYKNIRFINNPKKIQSAAFNIGVAHSDAPYIVRLDAHATYENNYIELCLGELRKNSHFGNVGGQCTIVPQHSRSVSEANAILNQTKFGIGGAAFRVGAKAGCVDTVPFGAFPRAVVEEIGGMREDLPRGEDNEYNSRIRKHGYKIYFDPRILSTYYARDTIGASMKQMYSNGFSIGRLLHIDKKAIGLRHLIPLIFVGSILCLFLCGFAWPFCWLLLLIELAAYFIADVISALLCGLKYGFKYMGILFLLFPLVHVSYGWGTIIGLIKTY